jgi:hypothetical protein
MAAALINAPGAALEDSVMGAEPGGEERSAGFGYEGGGEGGAGGGGSNGEHEEHAEFVARDKGDCLTQDAGAY